MTKSMCNVLMLSNSTMPGTDFFTWPRPWVRQFLGDGKLKLLFVPYAAIAFSFDEYESKVKLVFELMGYSLESIHHFDDKITKIEEADAIVVGGGNTFTLLQRMYTDKLVAPVRKKVTSGGNYIGWSAGANLACPTIMTTNDMPVVQPPSFEALNLVPFQINPHYHELKFENQGGETRKERLEEFLYMNPSKRIIGLPEGMLLQRNADKLVLKGEGSAKLYQHEKEIETLMPGQAIDFLLR